MVSFGMRRSRSPCNTRSDSGGISARTRATMSSADGTTVASNIAIRRALLLQLYGFEVRRHDDLQHLAVVRVVMDLVLDALGLQPGVAGLHGVHTLPLEFTDHGALQHVD